MDKERFKLRRKYVLNSLNEPQHLAKIKTLNLPKIQNKELEKLRERKLQNNELNSVRTNNQSKRETSILVFLWRDLLNVKSRAPSVNAKRLQGGEGKIKFAI